MDHSGTAELPDEPKQNKPGKRFAAIAAVVALVGLGAFFTRDQWAWYIEDDTVVEEAVVAPELEAEVGDRLFRIDPTQSSASYAVGERLAGQERGVAVGTTTALGGDIIIASDVAASEIGTIVINVELLKSDNNLRDKRIRHDFLESSHYRFAEFDPTGISGLPEEIVEGEDYAIEITGDLTLKETTNEETFAGTVRLDDEQLKATMTAAVLMSTYDIGPISVMALVTTEDEVQLTLDLVALDATTASEPRDPATEVVASDNVVTAPDADFSTAVLPIIEDRCASCHVQGGIGWQTMPLETVGDVAAIADGIGVVTRSGYMPPWPASDESVLFQHDWSLTPDQVTTLANWSAAGGPIDVDAAQVLTPTTVAWPEMPRDIVMRQAEPYAGSVEVKDDYRCQILDPQIDDVAWVKGYHFEPEIEEVHHVIVSVGDAEARKQADRLDGSDGKPGWTCYGLSGVSEGSVRGFGGWVPGQPPTTFPDGVGRKLNPGDFFIVQTHFHYDHDAPLDDSPMILDLATEEEADGLINIRSRTLITSVEIPCHADDAANPDYAEACKRENEIDRVEEAFGPLGRLIPMFANRNCGVTPADFAHMDQGVASSSCDLEADLDGTLFSVLGHMHELGASYRMTLNPDTPEEQVLLDIPRWTFEWQLSYRPLEEIAIKRDDIIRFECSWDRSLQPSWEPRYIVWAEGTQDEMCFSTVAVIPEGPQVESFSPLD